jgi:hypothetical protein
MLLEGISVHPGDNQSLPMFDAELKPKTAHYLSFFDFDGVVGLKLYPCRSFNAFLPCAWLVRLKRALSDIHFMYPPCTLEVQEEKSMSHQNDF